MSRRLSAAGFGGQPTPQDSPAKASATLPAARRFSAPVLPTASAPSPGSFSTPRSSQQRSSLLGSPGSPAPSQAPGPVKSPLRKSAQLPGGALAEFEEDAHIWISDADQVWISGKVARGGALGNGKAAVVVDSLEDQEDEPRMVADSPGLRCLRRNVELLGDGALRFDDLTEVPLLHEAAVLQALDVRFEHGIIYTLSGPVLLAVNPFRTLPGLYAPQTLGSFVGGDKLLPHVFSVANMAYQGIRQRDESQTVLVSGESGSGKTESTKFVMQFLALAGAEAVSSDGRGPLSRVERQVLGSNPLLEAFGNAKTLRNDNSSRFGKYTELQFGRDGEKGGYDAPRLVGARVHTYLLEQIRVTYQQAGERSFHIFYQLLEAAQGADAVEGLESFSDDNLGCVSELDLHSLAGSKVADFAYLRNSAQVRLASADDAKDFSSTLSALRVVGFGRGDLVDVFRVVAAVLHIGNIELEVSPNNSEGSTVATQASLALACDRLGLTESEMEGALCVRTMKSPEGMIRMANTVQQASEGRDALARHLYHSVFRSIVTRTNKSIGFFESALFCGVLDIFGFEFFEVNSFEQLSINYTNELLQQYFNSFIFENEQALYREEGIEFIARDFPDNSIIVNVLQQSPTGILPMLDEECFVVGGSTAGFETKLRKNHEDHPCVRFVRHKGGTFIVDHFAGPVTYTIECFLEKNRDRLAPDILRCLQGSSCEFVRHVCDESDQQPTDACAESDAPSKPRKRRTVSSEFRQQLQELMGQIRTTSPHFVRCIKPNPKNQPFAVEPAAGSRKPRPLFHRASVAEQLNYQGVLEAIQVARAGYPVRFLHADFFADFRLLAEDESRLALEAAAKALGAADARIVKRLLELPEVKSLLPAVAPAAKESEVARVTWDIGETKVFLKQDVFGALKAAQGRKRNTAARKLQTRHRMLLARRVAGRRRWALLALQAHFRGHSARVKSRLLRQQRASTAISTALRTLLTRDSLRRKRLVVTVVQSLVRMRRCQREYFRIRASIVKLQAWWRSSIRRRRWLSLPQRILTIQRMCRGTLGRRQAREWKASLHRFRCVLRLLLRTRRRNEARRRWRAEMMEVYHGFPSPWRVASNSDLLLKDYIALERQNQLLNDRVKLMRKQRQKLRQDLASAKSQFFPSLGF